MAKSISDETRLWCPNRTFQLTIWATGTIANQYRNCERWSCTVCAKTRLREIAQNLMDQGPENGEVWANSIAPTWSAAARDRMKKAKAAGLKLSLKNRGLFVISERELRGRGWALEVSTVEECTERLLLWDGAQPTRRDWSIWKPEGHVRSDRPPALFHRRFGSREECEFVMTVCGVTDEDRRHQVLSDPAGVASRMNSMLGDDEEG